MWPWLSMRSLCAANAVHLRGAVCALPTPCIRALPRKPYAGPPGGNIYYRFWTPELYYPCVVIITPIRLCGWSAPCLVPAVSRYFVVDCARDRD